jgi:two-component system cell cycle sensor histidine kinase/response regulator CckA
MLPHGTHGRPRTIADSGQRSSGRSCALEWLTQRGYTHRLSLTLPSNGPWGARPLMSRHDPTEVTRRHVFAQKGLSEKQEQACIVVLAGNLAGDKYAIGDELTFGRGEQASVNIDDTLVSRMHARLFKHQNGSYVIEDLESRNGTQVNGMAVARQILTYGDRIQIGSCLLLFAHHDPMEEQVAQRRKLEAIGRLGTGVAHDFNNLLGAVRARIDFLNALPGETKVGDRDVSEAFADIRTAAVAATEMTSRLLGFAREIERSHTEVDLTELCHHVVQLARHTFHRGIRIEAQIDRGLKVTGDRGQLHQLLMNLLINARDAMPNGGKLKIAAKKADQLDLEKAPLNPLVAHALVTVEDTGVGMDDATRERAFDPFFTTKGDQAGAGLGLAAVYEIAKSHNGHITLHSVPNRGSEFQVVFPLTSERPMVPTEPSLPAIRLPATQLLIMLVDDEDIVRRSAGRVVRQSGHRVIFARSGEEALQIYDETQPRPDLVLMDLNMPGMTGDQAFKKLRELDPEAPVVFVSGYWDRDLERELRGLGALGFVQKPYEAATLRDAIVQAMTAHTS